MLVVRKFLKVLKCQFTEVKDVNILRFLLGGNREGAIPDPIPNSEVKPLIADGTARKSAGE